MNNKKVLTIQDISCVGQCSITVALPIISACGIETSILPSAVLSTHTAGFKGYTYHDLTEDFPGILNHWIKEGIQFDCFYTGYLGSSKQIDYVKQIIGHARKDTSMVVVDPAMGDLGRLYPGFDEIYVNKMKELVSVADVVLPNLTEACFLTGTTYTENYKEEYILQLCEELHSLGCGSVVLTGVSFKPGHTGVFVMSGGETYYYEHRKYERNCHGTGDVYAATFTGAMMCGCSMNDSARIAADYTVKAIENTYKDENHWYGVRFEGEIPYLIKTLSVTSKNT